MLEQFSNVIGQYLPVMGFGLFGFIIKSMPFGPVYYGGDRYLVAVFVHKKVPYIAVLVIFYGIGTVLN